MPTRHTKFRFPVDLLELVDRRVEETGTTRTAFVISACRTALQFPVQQRQRQRPRPPSNSKVWTAPVRQFIGQPTEPEIPEIVPSEEDTSPECSDHRPGGNGTCPACGLLADAPRRVFGF